MKFFAVAAALVSVVPAMAQQLTINTATGIVQCQPIQFTWSGGTPPYFLALIPAAQPAAPAIKQFPTQEGTSFTWNVDLPSGSTFTVSLKDSSGATAFSDIETVNSGPDDSCLNNSASLSETGSSGPAATSGASQPASLPAATTSAGGSTGSSAPASKPASTGSSSTSASRTSSSGAAATGGADNSGALAITANTFGIAGLMGLIGAALF
ncbi:unnamed protein product [Somion occarium]|uniref:Uncharacterized protein n=1 Tax=Somion occarium TaxID=3059160 RepID=A0ABP1EBE6_9APHY